MYKSELSKGEILKICVEEFELAKNLMKDFYELKQGKFNGEDVQVYKKMSYAYDALQQLVSQLKIQEV